MRPYTSEYRLQGFSVREIQEPFEDAVLRISRIPGISKRKLKPGPLLNAIALWFLNLTEEQRVEFSREWLARLELFLAETDEERAEAEGKLTEVKSGTATYAGGADVDDEESDLAPGGAKVRPGRKKR